MAPTSKVVSFRGPKLVDGAIERFVEFDDGTGALETWSNGAWEEGGDAAGFLMAPLVPVARLEAAGVPKADWG